MRARVLIAAGVLTLAVVVRGLWLARDEGEESEPAPSAMLAPATAVAKPLADLLATVVVSPERPDGYARGLFRHWLDADDDGCDTRAEVLIAQAVEAPTITGICDLSQGRWFSEYDGRTIEDPQAVQVDHVVALAEAWASGAWAWTPYRRELYANDVGVPWSLIAVSSEVNQAKAGHDPSEWLPSRRPGICPYVAAWVGVKVRWSLAMDVQERAALQDLIADCPYTRLEVPIAPS